MKECFKHGHTLDNQRDMVAKEPDDTLGVRHKRDAGCNMTQQARIFLYKTFDSRELSLAGGSAKRCLLPEQGGE